MVYSSSLGPSFYDYQVLATPELTVGSSPPQFSISGSDGSRIWEAFFHDHRSKQMHERMLFCAGKSNSCVNASCVFCLGQILNASTYFLGGGNHSIYRPENPINASSFKCNEPSYGGYACIIVSPSEDGIFVENVRAFYSSTYSYR